jgi:hypothetical protein
MKFVNFIKKYWPDILILSGIFLLSYKFFYYEDFTHSIYREGQGSTHLIIEWWKIIGVILIYVGVDALIRKLKK